MTQDMKISGPINQKNVCEYEVHKFLFGKNPIRKPKEVYDNE